MRKIICADVWGTIFVLFVSRQLQRSSVVANSKTAFSAQWIVMENGIKHRWCNDIKTE